MDVRIALDPKLNLDAAEFAAAWNDGEMAAQGTARVGEAQARTFMDPAITVSLISAAVAIPGTVIANFISDYLKDKFIDSKPPKVTVTTISAPDGTPLLVVTQEEKGE